LTFLTFARNQSYRQTNDFFKGEAVESIKSMMVKQLPGTTKISHGDPRKQGEIFKLTIALRVFTPQIAHVIEEIVPWLEMDPTLEIAIVLASAVADARGAFLSTLLPSPQAQLSRQLPFCLEEQ
jgi:hypothetical protein